jgi:hypothetical protein
MDGDRCATVGRKESIAFNAKPPGERGPYRQRYTAGGTRPLPSTRNRPGERAVYRQPIKDALENHA